MQKREAEKFGVGVGQRYQKNDLRHDASRCTREAALTVAIGHCVLATVPNDTRTVLVWRATSLSTAPT